MNKKIILLAILATVGIVGAGIVMNAFAPVINQYADQQQAASNIRDRVTDAEYAQREYEWFKTQEEKIKERQRQIENVRTAITTLKDTYGNDTSQWSRTTRTTYNRRISQLQGYRNNYESLVSEYNAKMNMETRNLYNDSLPLEMEKKFWTGDLIP